MIEGCRVAGLAEEYPHCLHGGSTRAEQNRKISAGSGQALQMLVGGLVDFPEVDWGAQRFVMSLDRYIDTLAQPCQIGLNTLDRVRAKQLDTIKGRNPQGRQNRPDLAVVNSFEIVPPYPASQYPRLLRHCPCTPDSNSWLLPQTGANCAAIRIADIKPLTHWGLCPLSAVQRRR